MFFDNKKKGNGYATFLVGIMLFFLMGVQGHARFGHEHHGKWFKRPKLTVTVEQDLLAPQESTTVKAQMAYQFFTKDVTSRVRWHEA